MAIEEIKPIVMDSQPTVSRNKKAVQSNKKTSNSKQSPPSGTYYTSGGRKVGDFCIGFFGLWFAFFLTGLILSFFSRYAASFMALLIIFLFFIGTIILIIFAFAKGRKWIAIGILTNIVVSIILFIILIMILIAAFGGGF